MFWRIQLDREGGISACDPVEYQGHNGGKVIFVEADTKSEACSKAKAWYERYSLRGNNAQKRRNAAKRAAGVCQQGACQKPLATACYCREHADKHNAAERAKRLSPAQPKLSEGERAMRRLVMEQQRIKRAAAKRKATGYYYRLFLRRFDEMGPDGFRAWLVERIESAPERAKTILVRQDDMQGQIPVPQAAE